MKSLSHWLLVAGFVLLILGGKLWFVATAGSDLPSWDQWDAEGEVVLRPWVEGWFGLREILHPHNEHRLITTKLYALGLFVANGQWDARVETALNTIVHTLSALLLLLLARRWLGGPWLGFFGALLVLLFALPFSWENTLFGFQVQFYLLLLFSLSQISLTLAGDRFSWRWAAGQLAAVLAVATMASGFLASLAVFAVLAHRLVRERRWTVQQTTTAVLMVVLSAAGWFSKNYVLGHEQLKARSLGEFVRCLLEQLAWPGSAVFPWALVLFAPAVLFFVRRAGRRTTSSEEAVLLGLFSWVLLQCLATAYARAGGGVLSPRYLDLLAINVALGFVFLVREASGRPRRIVAAFWLVAVAAGLLQQSRQGWRDFVAGNITRQERQIQNVRAFLATGDKAHLLDKPWGDVPYPDANVLVQRLSSPALQGIMPASVRRPVNVTAHAAPVPQDLPAALNSTTAPVAVSTWSLPPTAGNFSWRSPAQAADALPILRFRIAGDLGTPGRNLRLVVKSAAGESAVIPDFPPGERWKTANVFRPAGPWWIEATDADPGAWFAFTQPVEVGRLSWLAHKILKHHGVVIGSGLTLLLIGAGLAALSRSRFSPAAPG